MIVVDFFLHAPDKETYLEVIPNLTLPTGQPLGRLPLEGEDAPPDGNSLYYPYGVYASEIGDIEGTPGYHVNMRAHGALAQLLTIGMPTGGNIFYRTRILSLIEGMNWDPITKDGLPSGYVGPNGIRLMDPDAVATPMRVWF